jgi:hypothetical protein
MVKLTCFSNNVQTILLNLQDSNFLQIIEIYLLISGNKSIAILIKQ